MLNALNVPSVLNMPKDASLFCFCIAVLLDPFTLFTSINLHVTTVTNACKLQVKR